MNIQTVFTLVGLLLLDRYNSEPGTDLYNYDSDRKTAFLHPKEMYFSQVIQMCSVRLSAVVLFHTLDQ